jgi:GTPase SAR1 family protein
MSNINERVALGQIVKLGTFYNAKTDNFLPSGLLKEDFPAEAINSNVDTKVEVVHDYEETYKKKFEMMGTSNELSASIIAGFVNVRGSGCYLGDKGQKIGSKSGVLTHTITTIEEKLNFTYPGLKNSLANGALNLQEITHVVAAVTWGARSVVVARYEHTSKKENSTEQFKAEFERFKNTITSRQDIGESDPERHLAAGLPLDVTVYSDILDENLGVMVKDLQEAFEFLEVMPTHIKYENGGKGVPVSYSLLPVSMLSFFLPIQVQGASNIVDTKDSLKNFAPSLDKINLCRQVLAFHESFILNHRPYVPASYASKIKARIKHLDELEQNFKKTFAATLLEVRDAKIPPENMVRLLEEIQTASEQLQTISKSYQATASFASSKASFGVKYIGYNGISPLDEIAKHAQQDVFVMWFNSKATRDMQSWRHNEALFNDLIRKESDRAAIIMVDCDATNDTLEKCHISHYRNGVEISNDLLEDRRFMADKCFARHIREQLLETEDVPKPIQRRLVKIVCPGKNCSIGRQQQWLCSLCLSPLEYGFSDHYIYCDCGRSIYHNFEFKCNGETHGVHYVQFQAKALLQMLQNLDRSNNINILILGETGVGKSTFINALVNYLEFASLDDAIGAEKLNWVIPCSFQLQMMDRDNPERPIEEKRIKIGSSDDEKDGSRGDSATQKTTVYPVTFTKDESTYTVRLIDTPGIGDIRGVEFDQQNMADILSTLSGYEELHGILILLKSNAARLTITFRYCVKELLTHLHHSAAANMAFGFTNTRISNYTPGDTYGPLKALLDQHSNVGLGLTNYTTYCFDSESFRYLAAHKSGIMMPNKPDFERSWKQSRDETIRLMNYFRSKKPHIVKNTLSLNGARRLISELTKPMADISNIIRVNIGIIEDQVQDLKDQKMTGDKLRSKLSIKKVQMESLPLNKPRTVCVNEKCMEVRDDGKGQDNKVIVYKSHCHPVCYLTDVTVDRVAHPGLINCAAFSGQMNCQKCQHYWQEHLHVLYELHEKTVTVQDSGIQAQLRANADDETLKKTAHRNLTQRIEEYKQELEIIRDAAAKFGIFLKKFSITPYNDATIAYLDHLIKEEQAKVQSGGSDKRLRTLMEDKQKHIHAIEVLTRTMNSGANWNDLTDGGIDRIVRELYGLKHFGKNLRNLKQSIASAHQATYREKPYNVQRKRPRKIALATRPSSKSQSFGPQAIVPHSQQNGLISKFLNMKLIS